MGTKFFKWYRDVKTVKVNRELGSMFSLTCIGTLFHHALHAIFPVAALLWDEFRIPLLTFWNIYFQIAIIGIIEADSLEEYLPFMKQKNITNNHSQLTSSQILLSLRTSLK